jgi:hypothetical protein
MIVIPNQPASAIQVEHESEKACVKKCRSDDVDEVRNEMLRRVDEI